MGPNFENISRILSCVVKTLKPNTPIQRQGKGFSCKKKILIQIIIFKKYMFVLTYSIITITFIGIT